MQNNPRASENCSLEATGPGGGSLRRGFQKKTSKLESLKHKCLGTTMCISCYSYL